MSSTKAHFSFCPSWSACCGQSLAVSSILYIFTRAGIFFTAIVTSSSAWFLVLDNRTDLVERLHPSYWDDEISHYSHLLSSLSKSMMSSTFSAFSSDFASVAISNNMNMHLRMPPVVLYLLSIFSLHALTDAWWDHPSRMAESYRCDWMMARGLAVIVEERKKTSQKVAEGNLMPRRE